MASLPIRSRVLALGVLALAFAAIAGCGYTVSTNASGASTPAAAGPLQHFVNSRSNAQAPQLAAAYVDFSFDYPGDWKPDPTIGTPSASDFARVDRNTDQGLTIETFTVDQFRGSGDPAADRAQVPAFFANFEGQLSTLQGYQRLAFNEPTTVNGMPGTQMTFSADPVSNGQSEHLFGRVVVLPGPAGQPNGVVLVMAGTSLSGELHSVADLGVKGQLPVILNSFRFGP